jgi:fluoroacetyl-CoA thioesterase
MKPLATGLRGVATCAVTHERTAEAFGSGLVPVYATPAMVALIEQAAVVALSDSVPPEQTTVGTRLEIAHLAATPLGDVVRAEAVLTAIDGRRLTFAVQAWDSSEKIGDGVHERAIVSRDRFLERVDAKRQRARP